MSIYPAASRPAAAWAVGFAVVGRLKSKLTLCKLVSAPRGCRGRDKDREGERLQRGLGVEWRWGTFPLQPRLDVSITPQPALLEAKFEERKTMVGLLVEDQERKK